MNVSVQTGWMRCVACSDFKRQPGRMWLGDRFIACPVCKGTGQVARFKIVDPRTGQEIDYEGQHLKGAIHVS